MYLGDFAVGKAVNFGLTTISGAGAAIAPSSAFEAADLKIFKNNGATPRSSASGVTMTSPFASITGLHQVRIDLSDNADAGFFAAGNDYMVVLDPDETVDSQTIVGIVAQFSIENRVASVTNLNAVADAVLTRDWTQVTGAATRSLLNAARFLRNKWSLIGGTLVVTEEDDSTTAWSATVSGSESAIPITGMDPT